MITGDITQVDLPSDKHSGLIDAQRVLKGIPGMAFTNFSEIDVVRHPLVQEIILAYGRKDAGHAAGKVKAVESRRRSGT